MKTMILILALLLSLSSTIYAGDLWTPGSPFNPIVITPVPGQPGKAQAAPQLHDTNRSLFAPGQPYNPYIIQRQPDGSTTIQSDLPFVDSNGGED
jgi:hypothetical protein